MAKKNEHELFLRFPIIRRIEHWMNGISFILLGITGLVQKFSDVALSQLLISSFGGIESTRVIHRISATALMLAVVMHIGTFLYSFYVQRKPLSMLPNKNDIINAWKSFRYNFGLEKNEPKQGFYTFEEKFEYWALIWGTIVMGITGFFLWNPIITAKYLPGSWIPVAKAAHSGEALLAVLAVLIWHFYHVFIKHFNKSMYSGYIEMEVMKHEHPLALTEEKWIPPANNAALKRRKTIFWGVYTVIAAVLLGGVYWFLTIEDTAVAAPAEIADLQEIEAVSFLEPTPIPMSAPVEPADIGDSWNDGIGEFVGERCGMCHVAGNKSGLDLTSYDGAVEGGDSGPGITPGSSGISLMVLWGSNGKHYAQFVPEELAAIRAWIDAGAPEN